MKNKLKHHILLYLYISLINITSSQYQNDYEFIPLGDDINQTTISTIIKDNDGLLWLCSMSTSILGQDLPHCKA